MAFSATKIGLLKTILSDLNEAVAALTSACEFAESHEMHEPMLQANAAPGYAQSLVTFATDSNKHIRDQVACRENGQEPLWKKAKKRTAANAAIKNNFYSLESAGHIKPEKKVQRKIAKPPKKRGSE